MSQEMKKYSYVGATPAGKRVKGEVEATSDKRAYAILMERGLAVESVKHNSGTGMQMEIKIPGFNPRVKLKHLAVMTKQFSSLIASGMPLIRCLAILISQTPDKKLKEALSAVLADVETGISLSEAMEKHPLAFPQLMISLIRVGEGGGFLDQSLASIAKTYKAEVELKAKVKSAMTYPMVVLGIAILAVIGMLLFIVPTFTAMFEQLGSELPAITQLLVTLSENMIVIGPIVLVLTVGTTIFVSKNKDKEWYRSRVHPVLMKIPIAGPLSKKISLSRFSRNLAMMIGAGVPLMNALSLVGPSSNNYLMEEAFKDSMKSMEKGIAFSKTLENHSIFPMILPQMAFVGEESGRLPEMLGSVADFYDDEVKETTDSLASILEPLMIVVIGGIVGTMIVALYLPMFSVFDAVSAA